MFVSFLFSFHLDDLSVRVGYGSPPLLVLEGQYVISAAVVFLLQTWVSLCLMHSCSDLKCHPGEFFL